MIELKKKQIVESGKKNFTSRKSTNTIPVISLSKIFERK